MTVPIMKNKPRPPETLKQKAVTQFLIKSLLKRNINQELKELLAFELEVIK
ncbi:MAG: hypothetical protein GY739_06940 [Mesoflavibacter sp.]|nr:hypothetical protein [Mesoflavibacter sp.]